MLHRSSLNRLIGSLTLAGVVAAACGSGEGTSEAPPASEAQLLGEAGAGGAPVAGAPSGGSGGVAAAPGGGTAGIGRGPGGKTGAAGNVSGVAGRASGKGGGPPGTGGTAPGTGGTGPSSGGAVGFAGRPTDCPPIPTWQSGLIDDFQDGDLLLPTSEGLNGHWLTNGDPSGTPDPAPSIQAEVDPDDPSNTLLHAFGGQFVNPQWGAAVSAYFSVTTDTECTANADEFVALSLRLKINGSVRITLPASATEPVVYGGGCDGSLGACYNHFGFDVTGDGSWQTLVLPFSDVHQQPNWGAQVACFAPATLMGVAFNFAAVQTPYEMWVDDIELVRETGPDCSLRPVLTSGLIDDFEDGDLALPAALGGGWSASYGAIEVATNSEVSDLTLHGAQYGGRLTATFAPPGAEACGIDASAFDGIEIRGYLPPSYAAAWYSASAGLPSSCDECRNAYGCNQAQLLSAAVPTGTTGGWRTYRFPFVDTSVDTSRLVSLALDTVGETWLEEVRLYHLDSPPDLGEPCEKDDDCATSWCIQSADGSPAHGVCSLPCTAQSSCTAWNPHSACVGGFCQETCTTNDSGASGLRSAKCHGRSDMACDESGLCQPRCTADDQCGGGLYCGSDGLCSAKKPKGTSAGSACDPDAIVPTCAGSCPSLIHTCTSLCTIGCSGDECESCPDPSQSCLPLLGYWAGGDLGACGTTCTCNADCAGGLVCLPVTLAVPLDRPGLCVAATFGGEGIAECPSACQAGQTRACRGASNCLGSAKCRKDGSGFGACQCGSAPSSGGTQGSAGAPGTSGNEASAGEGSAEAPGGQSSTGAAGSGGTGKSGAGGRGGTGGEGGEAGAKGVGSSRVDLQACKLEYSIVSPK